MRKILAILFVLASFAITTHAQRTGSANLSGSGTACLSTGTTPNCISLPIDPATTSASVSISGTFSATAQFEVSGDQGNTFQALSMSPTGGGSNASSATAAGLWTACVSALNVIRVRNSGLASGSVSVTINTSTAEVASCGGGGGGGAGVSSFSGDGSLLTNSASTGAVTATIGSASAHTFFGNNTGSPATGSFLRLACADLSNAAASCATDATNAANIASGTLPAGRLPNPSASTLGGIESIALVTHDFLTSISTSGVPAQAQPACGDLSNAAASCSTDATNGSNISSGTINQARLPATSTQTIASGTSALGTSLIGSGACASVVTTTATGTATTDNIEADFNADPTSTTGYSPSTGGMLTIIKYPTSNNVNFKVCNNTGASITPGAVTLNWRVVR